MGAGFEKTTVKNNKIEKIKQKINKEENSNKDKKGSDEEVKKI